MLENETRPRIQFLGFLNWQKTQTETELTVRAAVLVVDRSGHPMEFRYTDTVCVNQVQQTLYGSQFVTGFLGKVLFEPLIASVSTDVSVWMVQDTELRSLRPTVAVPVLEVTAGSIGDWPKFCTHTLFPQDLDVVSALYETAGQWSCMEVFNRMQIVLQQMPEESIVTVVPPRPLPPRPVEAPVVAAVAVEEPAPDEARLDSFDEQPEPEKPAGSDSTEREPESVQAQLERLLMHLMETNQLQPTHYGFQVSGSLMWIHRAHFFNLAEAVQGELPLTVEIDRELLRRSAQKGVIEAYEVYKELYGKMAVAFKLDLRKYPKLSELVLTAVRSGS